MSLAKGEAGPVAGVHGSGVARFRHRLLPAGAICNSQTRMAGLTKAGIHKAVVFNASIAELLLVNRLKARVHPSTQSTDILERASNIVFVTCKNWFYSTEETSPQRPAPL
jgi:hypothetical protein